MASKIPYKIGDRVTPIDSSYVNKYGDDLVVEKICNTYGTYGKDEEWPAHDYPMIVTLYSAKTDTRFNCTPNFVKNV